MSKSLLTLGVQSPEGQKRVSLAPASKTEELYKAVVREFDLKSAAILLYRDQRRQEPIESSRLKSLASVGLKHGDRVFMFPKSKADQVLFLICIWQSHGNCV
jgi:nuclear protein localization family protein 4